MDTERLLRQAITDIKIALVAINEHADRGATAAINDTAQELVTLIDDLPESIVDAETQHCQQCHYWQSEQSTVPYADRSVMMTICECTVPHAKQCPVVIRCGLGDPQEIQIPAFLQRQAS